MVIMTPAASFNIVFMVEKRWSVADIFLFVKIYFIIKQSKTQKKWINKNQHWRMKKN